MKIKIKAGERPLAAFAWFITMLISKLTRRPRLVLGVRKAELPRSRRGFVHLAAEQEFPDLENDRARLPVLPFGDVLFRPD